MIYLIESQEYYKIEILDLRFRDNWIKVGWDYKNKRRKTEQEIHDYIKNLPENITFFFGDAHL